MPVLSELQPLLERIRAAPPPDRSVALAERRAQVHAGIDAQQTHMVEPVPIAKHADHRVRVEGGEITVRIYRPPDARLTGCHVFVHGGGWWMGTLDQSDQACSRIVRAVGCAVASVDHRLAPEHPYPTPVQDCVVALEWLVGHAGELGLAQDRISIGGVSSGANLAAAAVLHARDGNGPALIAQVLDIPVLDLTMSQPSIDAFASGYMLTRERLAQEIDDYCPPERRTERRASPLLADDVAGLPPTLIATAEYDLLRDDGERYAERLADAGVPVTTHRWPGHVHGSLALTGLVASSHDWHARDHAFLREHHQTTREA